MRLRSSQIMAEREERKKRQEKFRKRSKSLFNKTKLLASDTDAWVALIVRDPAGGIKSFRSSNKPHWPPGIKSLETAHPSGSHEYLEKCATSRRGKEMASEESGMGLLDGNAESDDETLDEEVLASSNVSTEKEAEVSNVITVHDEDEIGADTSTDESMSNGIGISEADGLRESYLTLRLQEADGLDATIDEAGPSDDTFALLDSDLPSDTILVDADVTEESNDTVECPTASSVSTQPKLIVEDYSMEDKDVPVNTGEADPIEAAHALYALSQPSATDSSNGWQVVNRPMIANELLQSWSWVFQGKKQLSAVRV